MHDMLNIGVSSTLLPKSVEKEDKQSRRGSLREIPYWGDPTIWLGAVEMGSLQCTRSVWWDVYWISRQ